MIHYQTDLFSTYSIVARDEATGQLGVAVQTHQMGVGRVVPWLLPGVGAIATQAMSNVSFGPLGLAMLQEGVPAPKVLSALIASDEGAENRQVAAVDAQGRAAAYTGSNCIAEAGHHTGEGYSVQANMMTNPTVIQAMAQAYEQANGNLAERMLAAMEAAQREGGDIRGMQSAALKIVPGDSNGPGWRADYDLRVDEHAQPLTELRRLVRLRGAKLLSSQGDELLEQGDRAMALRLWQQARETAPELEELAFWQAVRLADRHADVETAAEILKPVLDNDPRRSHWLDLIERIQACGIIERPGAGKALVSALS